MLDELLLKVLVDAPDMVRGQMNLKRLSLTDIKIDIEKVPKKKTLIDAMEAAGMGAFSLYYVACIMVNGIHYFKMV